MSKFLEFDEEWILIDSITELYWNLACDEKKYNTICLKTNDYLKKERFESYEEFNRRLIYLRKSLGVI